MSAVHLAGHVLTDPIAVFDAGIGSYSAVAHIHRRFPEQDLVCLADRASFPYGLKTLPELRATIERTLDYLAALPVAAVVVASNVPSVTMLDDAIAGRKLPVSGIVPPVREALGATDGDVAVLGVRTLVTSAELTGYIAREAGPDIGRVHARDASSLVELVESGAFLFAADQTQEAVTAYVDALARELPDLAAITLSSTHLPWLREFFARAPRCRPVRPHRQGGRGHRARDDPGHRNRRRAGHRDPGLSGPPVQRHARPAEHRHSTQRGGGAVKPPASAGRRL